ncbi:MAG: bifunctional folylpolyglutamate synthase/dihydrofolate synthase [Lachnospiraceae bacterium]|jgi:dihydrofolate synthase/folylpolyglutamate synthase|nr:bifunctional folylpolyglutamate synthase/dihydrofolate synthase [Lachnospiraceae bacterium]
MTYKQAEEFVESTKKYGSILGLGTIRNLMRLLGDVQEKLAIVHVAGTNGKGSVCAFLSAALGEAGYLVGRFNSPVVFEKRESFRIGESIISETEYADVMEQIQIACEQLVAEGKPHPTAFEVETAAAFLWFYQRKCDLALLETGMGGESDATNLIPRPVCSVLTSIAMDHMQYLGNTLKEIAAVKAGIIKQGCPVIALEQKQEVNETIRERAEELRAPYVFSNSSERRVLEVSLEHGLELEHDYYGNVRTRMAGTYQVENLTLALCVLKQLEKSGYALSKKSVRDGIKKAIWHGRFEVVRREPLFIIDGAHNTAAVQRLQETIEKDFTNKEIIYIIGVLEDKEYIGMIKEILRPAKKVYTVTPNNPRALDGKILAQRIREYRQDVTDLQCIEDAVRESLLCAKKEDVIIAFGSLSYLGEVTRVLATI